MKKIVLSAIATLAIATTSLVAADVVATVNGENITKQDVKALLRNPQIKFDTLPKETQTKIVDQLVEKKLLTANAQKSGVEKKEAYTTALKKLKAELALEVWMQEEFKKIKVTDKNVKDYYTKNKDKFKTGEMLEARHILVKTDKEAKDLIARLNKAKNKKATFEKLAKEFSTGPTGAKGGYLGKFSPKQMVPEFSKAAMALKKGQYSKQPVKTQFGFHIIYLENKEASKAVTFDKVSKKIKQALTQEQYTKLIKAEASKLRKKANIVIK
jgi:parvulin-like peptidyl-prolyl isomerase